MWQRARPRDKTPRKIVITPHDLEIVRTIYDFEGKMSRWQLAQVCFGGREDNATRRRLRQLYEAYVINALEDRTHGMIYWLDKEGMALVDEQTHRYSTTALKDPPKKLTVDHDI